MIKNHYLFSYSRLLLIIILAFSFVLCQVKPAPASAEDLAPVAGQIGGFDNEVDIISSSSDEIILEFTSPSPEVIQNASESCQIASIAGLSNEMKLGQAPLPVKNVMIGIPADARPQLSIEYLESSNLAGLYRLCPSQQPVIERGEHGLPVQNGTKEMPYDMFDAFIPAQPVSLAEDGFIRAQRFVAVQFNPLQYNAYSGSLKYYSKIQVSIKFNQERKNIDNQAFETLDINFEELYQHTLLNYDQAKPWRVEKPIYDKEDNQDRNGQPVFKVLVEQDGLYKMEYSYLEAAGVPVSTLDPRTFRAFNQGSEIAIQVEGEQDGVFAEGEYILFYGQKNNTRYSDTNVYWLSWGGEYGLRMDAIDGAPVGILQEPNEFLTTLHLEDDVYYFSEFASGDDEDHWYWTYVESGEEALTFNITNISTAENIIQLSGLITPYEPNSTPTIQVFINSNPTPIYNNVISSDPTQAFSTNFLQSDLVEGENSIRIAALNDTVLINRFFIEYYDTYIAESDLLYFDGDLAGSWEFKVDGFSSDNIEAYDLTNPKLPVRVLNPLITSSPNGFMLSMESTISEEHHYLATNTANFLLPSGIFQDTPSDLKNDNNAADYIIISHSDFIDAMQPLATHRQSLGYQVALVDVQDVYDEFNFGIFAPEAIQSFLAYAYEHWAGLAPSYVLLVGDGHYDYKNFEGTNEPIFIPPLMANVDPWLGEVPTDNWFVRVSGSDILPDMFIGRFPVSTVQQTQVMVNKVLAYEQNPPADDWNTKLTFLADNKDTGGDYAQESDDMIAIIPSLYSTNKIYYKINYPDSSLARSEFIAALNEGRLIAHYAGHAGLNKWADEGLFRIADINSLTNGSKLPFMLPMACLEGFYAWPGFPSIAETIVRKNGGGAIASFSPTGFGLSVGHSILDASIMENLFNRHYNQLGYLTTQSKYDIYNFAPSHNYLIHTYMLFGDPALRLKTLPMALEDPIELDATAVSSLQINLSWQDTSDTETGFRIERSLNGLDGWVEIDRVGENVTTYQDSGLQASSTYYYRVRAYREGDAVFSAYSNIDFDTTFSLFKYFLPLIKN